MKTPACDPGDFYVALRAESTLLIPEIAKSAGTPKRFQHVSPFAFFKVGLPSGQAPLLGPSPLRTVHASFPAHSSSTANASFRETRLRYGKMLAVNPVVALWMEQNAVFYTRGTTFHTRDAIVNAPARDPSDRGVAHGAEPALERPEKAKSPRTPKRFRHMVSFAFFEVGLMGRIVGISGALDLDVPLNRRATGEQ
jgi:hypothetical protein